MSSLKNLIKKLPGYATEISAALDRLIIDDCGLTQEQFSGVILSAGYAISNDRLLNHIRGHAKLIIDEDTASICKTAAIVTKSVSSYIANATYAISLDEAMANLGISLDNKIGDGSDNFPLFCYAVSIVCGCRTTIDEHESKLREIGFTPSQLDMVHRLVAVLDGIGLTLFIESVRTYEFGRESNYS